MTTGFPGTSAPDCTGVRPCVVGRRTHVLGARAVRGSTDPVRSWSRGRRSEVRGLPRLGATCILPSGLSPSVPDFHRLNRLSS